MIRYLVALILFALAPAALAQAPNTPPSWAEEFAAAPGAGWLPSISPYPAAISERIHATGELAVFTNSQFVGPQSVMPVSGTALFMARRMEPATRVAVDRRIVEQKTTTGIAPHLETALKRATWTSGTLSTARTFYRGYYEVSANFSPDKSAWNSIYLYSREKGFELDINETPGDGLAHCTVHWGSFAGKASVTTKIDRVDRFHRYGVLWEADKVTCYHDGKAFGVLRFPAGVDGPAHLNINLAVGGWAKAPDAKTPAMLKAQVDYVRAWEP